MIIRVKDGIAKSKTYHITLSDFNINESKLVKHASQDHQWKASMKIEYKALIKNNIWTLIEAPKDIVIIGNKCLLCQDYIKWFSRPKKNHVS